MRPLLALVAACTALLAHASPAEASGYLRSGLQDDAWIAYGPAAGAAPTRSCAACTSGAWSRS